MRKKFIDKVYMREVLDKVWYLEKNDDFGGYIALKYIKELTSPVKYFCNGREYVGLDKGYSILEYVPLDKGYNCRVFVDRSNRPLSFYFDINNGTGVDDGMPWYDDLYLDVILDTPTITGSCLFIRLDDVKEFESARMDGVIDEETYNRGYIIARRLMEELRNQENFIVDRCVSDIYRIKQKLGL